MERARQGKGWLQPPGPLTTMLQQAGAVTLVPECSHNAVHCLTWSQCSSIPHCAGSPACPDSSMPDKCAACHHQQITPAAPLQPWPHEIRRWSASGAEVPAASCRASLHWLARHCPVTGQPLAHSWMPALMTQLALLLLPPIQRMQTQAPAYHARHQLSAFHSCLLGSQHPG